MFTINFNDDELYYFNLLRQDLTILIQSECYETYDEILNAINFIKVHGYSKSIYFRKVTDNKQYYFVIISSFGKLVATSFIFPSFNNRELCIKEVMELSGKAHIYENFE